MTLHSRVTTARPEPAQRFRLPDIPEREPDEVTQFDQLFRTGLSHALAVHLGNPETRLAGERLGEDGRYRAIEMDVDTGDEVRGYSAALGLSLRWQGGQLAFGDADTGQPIATLADERNRADTAEARVRELEALLRRQNS